MQTISRARRLHSLLKSPLRLSSARALFPNDSGIVESSCGDLQQISRHHSSCSAFGSLRFSGIGKVAEYFSRSMNSKITVCSPYALSSGRLIHSSAPKDDEKESDFRPMDFVRGAIEDDRRGGGFQFPPKDFKRGMGSRSMDFKSMDFVRGVIEEDRRGARFQFPRTNVDHDVDIVHIKLMRNNTFVTVTDAKGNRKLGASTGSIHDLKGKSSKYASEATAEHVGRMSRNLGLKSVVMRVKGCTYFKKKRQAIISWREGFTNSKVERNHHSPVVYIEDATRKPHNGCRLPRQRRV